MARRIIRCAAAPGFDGCFRAGRKWPASGTEVEIISGDQDIEATKDTPLQIGQRTFKALEEDKRFSFGIAGSIEDSDALRARAAEMERFMGEAEVAFGELKTRLEEARARVAELEKGNASLKDQASALAAENAQLKAQLAASAPAAPKGEKAGEKADEKGDKGKGGK